MRRSQAEVLIVVILSLIRTNVVTRVRFLERTSIKGIGAVSRLPVQSMPAASSSSAALPPRTQYRHELRTLTYVTLDDGNGGIVRNLNHDGAALQVVARLRPEQRVRLRFQLKTPRTTVDVHGQVSWTTASGACGIRFVDLPTRTRNQIDEWIFSDLLDCFSVAVFTPESIFETSSASKQCNESDGLILSASERPPIRLAPTLKSFERLPVHRHAEDPGS